MTAKKCCRIVENLFLEEDQACAMVHNQMLEYKSFCIHPFNQTTFHSQVWNTLEVVTEKSSQLLHIFLTIISNHDIQQFHRGCVCATKGLVWLRLKFGMYFCMLKSDFVIRVFSLSLVGLKLQFYQLSQLWLNKLTELNSEREGSIYISVKRLGFFTNNICIVQ